MILKKLQIVSMFLLLFSLQLVAQDKKLTKANEAYDNFAFVKAAKLYSKEIENGNNSVEVYSKLGNSYYYNGDYPQAAACYARVVNIIGTTSPEYYFRYAQTLNNSKKYNEAAAVMKEYYKKSGKLDLSKNWSEEKLLNDIKIQSGRYNTKVVGLNTPFSDFGTAFYDADKVIYATAKDIGVIVKRKHSWNEKAFLKLYTAQITASGELKDPVLLKGDVNSKYHQSTPAVTKDGKYMYFTRNNFIDGKLGTDKNGTSFLKIYVAENVKGEWTNIKELPFPINSDGFSSAHPALSADESQLFFVSDRNNDFGNSDLYVVNLKKGALAGNDVNRLGDEINTLGRETYPFVDNKGVLFFASDGHPGLGGLDIFAAIKDLEGKYHVVNVGDGVNSTSDDFAYIVNNENQKGYFSSNRSGNDEIYSFTETKPLVFDVDTRAAIFGTITESSMPVPDFNVKLFNINKEVIGTAKTDNEGKYEMKLTPFQKADLLFSKEKYAEKTVNVEPLKPMERKEVSFEITKEMEIIVDGKAVSIKRGDNLAEILKLRTIYFDLNGYNIRKSSKKELDKVVALMKDHPNIIVKVNSYTDSRGRDEFNMKLSQNRAKATVEYIIKEGISNDRISGEGFGETLLLNDCSNGVKCSEKEHEVNRRSEFIINY